jgi:hypothetical protein
MQRGNVNVKKNIQKLFLKSYLGGVNDRKKKGNPRFTGCRIEAWLISPPPFFINQVTPVTGDTFIKITFIFFTVN